jgi:cytochrome oxidase assembly protein ShyY1
MVDGVVRVLLTPRWLALSVGMALLALVCVWLGRWQLDRLEHRRLQNAVVTGNTARAPVPVTELLADGGSVTARLAWRRVTATGHYDAAEEMLVRNRTLERRLGLYVLTPLILPNGTALLVDRGWVPAGRTARDRPAVPAPPDGEVTVIARLRPGESRGRAASDLPPGELNSIHVPHIAARLGYPVYGGYADLVEQVPPASGAAPKPLPAPEVSAGPHLAYAVEWFLFGGLGVLGWGLLVRQELLARRPSAAPAGPPRPS